MLCIVLNSGKVVWKMCFPGMFFARYPESANDFGMQIFRVIE